ncbi:Protein of unknown function [Rhodovulum sp. ES.010]|uniref:DUF1217 domain-containing protein n=1 Tax=Rhodovulum sp. ES.010 TaxID=1882821 RepID=UPI000928C2FD|nr:DUF1217 domain-containing protein [Rhodovulum sp. ES.010]SIO49914.1 Protein of unknown function [Rhodovulum sp. ES.010]
MSFQPVVPFGGFAGWRFLERTMERQQDAFNESPAVQRDLDYFAEKIGDVKTADDLVGDYRLLKVALGAFGLQDDIGSKFFIKKVLSEGTTAEDAFATKLSDKSYERLAEAFSFLSADAAAARTDQTTFARDLSLEIEGDGYLPVRLDSGETGYTRNAALERGAGGRLVTSDGHAVRPEIVIDETIASVSVSARGAVYGAYQPGGPQFLLGEIELATFSDATALQEAPAEGLAGLLTGRPSGVFLETGDSGPAVLGSAGSLGFGKLVQTELAAAETAFDTGAVMAAYRTRSFELAVGEQDGDMRLALNLDRELQDLAARDLSDEAQWFGVMGSNPLREVFDTAFGMPDAFAALDLDRQLETYRERADSFFGDSSVAQFSDPDKREELVRLFLARSEANALGGGMTGAQTALTLLGG